MKRLFRILIMTWAAMPLAGAAEDVPPTLRLGSSAPEFDLPAVDGRNYRLGDFASAKVLLVVFTCNHCPTAQYYEPRLKQLVSDYQAKGVALVAISPNDPRSVRLDELGWSDTSDSFAEMKQRALDQQFNFPYLYDGDKEVVSRAYGPAVTPHAFVFDAGRKLRYVGRIDDSERPQHVKVSYVRDAIEALLAGKEPPLAQTRPVGCSVKWAGKAQAVQAYLDKLAAEPVTLAPVDDAALKALRRGNPAKFRLVCFWTVADTRSENLFPELVTINRMYRHREFELIAVSADPPGQKDQVLAFLKKAQASNQNFLLASADRDQLMAAFEPSLQGALPFVVLLSPEGKIIYRETSRLSAHAVKRAIVAALNERKPW